LVFGWFKKNGKTLTQAPASPLPDVSGATELSDAAHAKIKDLCALGDQHATKREFDAALRLYWEAFDLLPEPSTRWEAGTWILTAIGDANFLARDFVAGRDNGNRLAFSGHLPTHDASSITRIAAHFRQGCC